MKPVVKKATPAAIAVLRQATAICPSRTKASDGLLPSKAHIHQNPNSDHNTGYAVDLTHDRLGGIDCAELFIKLQDDPRVKYLIFKGHIWSKQKGTDNYTGPNPHNKHLHISIKACFSFGSLIVQSFQVVYRQFLKPTHLVGSGAVQAPTKQCTA